MLCFGVKGIGAFCSKGICLGESFKVRDFCLQEFRLDSIPPLERRRLGNATKCAFSLFGDFCFKTQPKIIFSSYSGELNACLNLLRCLDKESFVSPTQFSLSVLNATPSNLAIATQNQNEISTISGMPSLEYGLINVNPKDETLLIVYEEFLKQESFDYLMVMLHLCEKDFIKKIELDFKDCESWNLNDDYHPLKLIKYFYDSTPKQWNNHSNNLFWRWNIK